VAVSYGAHPVDDFARFAPLFVAHSTRDLHDWLHAHA
jgi:phosphoglycolate phosphatase